MTTRDQALLDGLVLAPDGTGPLLQRDYWGVIASCRTSPTGVMAILRHRFSELAPAQLAAFSRMDGTARPLELGDEMHVAIRGAGTFGVRIVHSDRQSFTIGTLRGHPEAGRVTFGAYRNPRGDVVFHIRSRARASSRMRYAGFLAGGEPMQTSTWCELINRTAAAVGEGVIGFIQAQTSTVDEDAEDRYATGPTFKATGD